MESGKQQKIQPVALAYEVRRAVCEILNKPFTERIDHQVFRPDKKVLALWAADCAEHVLSYFENECPNDNRPKEAIQTCRTYADTGVFKMQVIRGASLSAHNAAKAAKNADSKFAAHAAGQAVATAHVPTHALAASVYAIRAAASHSGIADDGLVKEHNWQLNRLRKYACNPRGTFAD
ncbi:MAG: hypothetical protein NWF04_09905 [Candidatus Bathyarchaeota archaeon]|nr:hypothetical protein [Candidatus Bathyarchaeota archaeon]